MKPMIILFALFMLSACAHSPKCGTPVGAKVIFDGEKTCSVRIRQVTVGSEMKIPASLKNSMLSEFRLEWVEPVLSGGKIELGHFVLIQSSEALK